MATTAAFTDATRFPNYGGSGFRVLRGAVNSNSRCSLLAMPGAGKNRQMLRGCPRKSLMMQKTSASMLVHSLAS